MKFYKVDVFLIPHSSTLSKFLKFWQDKNETGIIGVAGILNLLTGGYKMQNHNIPSQCVFLDYCGCKKHWHDEGIPTRLNLQQLIKIVKQENDSSINNHPGLTFIDQKFETAKE